MEDAVDSALEAARQSLKQQQQQQQGGSADVQPTLAMVFVSSAFAEEYERIVELIKQRVPSIKHVSGSRCSWTGRLLCHVAAGRRGARVCCGHLCFESRAGLGDKIYRAGGAGWEGR